MARKTSKPSPVEPEDESQDVPEAGEHQSSPGRATISKTEAVHKALAAGHDKPLEAVEYIRKTFGIEMGAQHFSSIKSNWKKQSGQEPERRGPKKVAKTAGAPKAAARKEHTQRASTGDTDLLDDMAAVRNLVQKLGAEKVRKIVGLFE